MKTLNCPNCPAGGSALVIVERQGIEIDYCPTCRGVWLDRGELDKLLNQTSDRDDRNRRDRDDDRHRGRDPDRSRDQDWDEDRDDDDDRSRFGFGDDRRSSAPRRRREGILGELFDF